MKLDEFHYHEAMDRLLTIQTMLNELLAEHPAVEAHEELLAAVFNADSILADAYQECGRIRARIFPEGDGL